MVELKTPAPTPAYKHTRVTYQNKIFDLTLLTFIMAVLGSIELKMFFSSDFSELF